MLFLFIRFGFVAPFLLGSGSAATSRAAPNTTFPLPDEHSASRTASTTRTVGFTTYGIVVTRTVGPTTYGTVGSTTYGTVGVDSLERRQSDLFCLRWLTGEATQLTGRTPKTSSGTTQQVPDRIWNVVASEDVILVLTSPKASGKLVLRRYSCEHGLLWEQFAFEEPHSSVNGKHINIAEKDRITTALLENLSPKSVLFTVHDTSFLLRVPVSSDTVSLQERYGTGTGWLVSDRF